MGSPFRLRRSTTLLVPLMASLAVVAWAGLLAAQEACYADYKASRRDPLELHYGVAEIRGECDRGAARRELAPRLAADGWQLLEVVSTFGPSGLEERRASADGFFLRY